MSNIYKDRSQDHPINHLWKSLKRLNDHRFNDNAWKLKMLNYTYFKNIAKHLLLEI